MRRLSLVVLLAGCFGILWGAGNVVPLPNAPAVTAIQRDAAGHIFIGGSVAPAQPKSQNDRRDAFVAELSTDGAQVLFWTTLAGSDTDGVSALALAPDGSILATGATSSADFPVSADALPIAITGGQTTGFFVKLDAKGDVVYATLLPGVYNPQAIASDAVGAAYITGQGNPPVSGGAMGAVTHYSPGLFVMKLDSAGRVVFATDAIGGSLIAVDARGSIYVAGIVFQSGEVPVTPAAFQTAFTFNACGATAQMGFPCAYQFVAKLDRSAKRFVYATYLNGTYGAVPNALAVDETGSVIVAGSTGSSDYPITPAAFQTADHARLPPLDNTGSYPGLFFPGPASTGFVSILDATGRRLIFSTFLGGSGADAVNSIALDAQGNMILAGLAGSPDFPGVQGIPDGCRPTYVYPALFLTQLSADGASLARTQLVFGPFAKANPLAASAGRSSEAAFAAGGLLAFADLSAPAGHLVCAIDAADFAPLATVVPGQLVALLGSDLGFAPDQPGSVSVAFNGIPAPILYSAPWQINVQVPYEIAGAAHAALSLTGAFGGTETRDFTVAASAPSAFLQSAAYVTCGATTVGRFLPVARNADGSINSCQNPATQDSTISVYVNSLGAATTPPPVTGAIASAPGIPLPLPVQAYGPEFVDASLEPGSIDSVWRIRLKLPVPSPSRDLASPWLQRFDLTIGGVPLRDPLVVLVKKPN